MLERARHHIRAAADHCSECFGAAREVDDLDIEPFVLEVAELLGDCQWQVVQQVLAADGNRDLGFFKRLCKREAGQGSGGQAARDEMASLHGNSPVFDRTQVGRKRGA